MRMRNIWRRTLWPVVLGGLSIPFTVHCGLIDGVRKGANSLDPRCPEMESGDLSQFTIKNAPVVEADVKAFLSASYSFNKIVVDMETSLIASCGAIAKDIGVDEAALDLKPDRANGSARVCGAVASKISDVLKANPGVTLSLVVGAPKCEVDVGTVTTCLGVAFDPAALKVSCQGGDIGGQCDGDCQGTCSASANTGSAESGAGARCSGTCRGGCSMPYKAPTCSGDFKPLGGAYTEKKALACGLKGIAATKCDVPITISVNGSADADLQKVVTSLQANLPAIAAIQAGTAPKLLAASTAAIKAGVDMKSSFGPQVGIHGVGCVAVAIAKVASASAGIRSDVDASASVRVSLSGGAGLAQAGK